MVLYSDIGQLLLGVGCGTLLIGLVIVLIANFMDIDNLKTPSVLVSALLSAALTTSGAILCSDTFKLRDLETLGAKVQEIEQKKTESTDSSTREIFEKQEEMLMKKIEWCMK